LMSKVNLRAALKILNAHDEFTISDLPTDAGSTIWNMIKSDLGLSTVQLSALQNYASTINKAELPLPLSSRESAIPSKRAATPSPKKLSASAAKKRKTSAMSSHNLYSSFLQDEEEIIEVFDDDKTLSPPPSAVVPPLSKKLFHLNNKNSSVSAGGFNFDLFFSSSIIYDVCIFY